jgi:hypothetical protein
MEEGDLAGNTIELFHSMVSLQDVAQILPAAADLQCSSSSSSDPFFPSFLPFFLACFLRTVAERETATNRANF